MAHPNAQTINVLNPYGDPENIPASSWTQAQAAGYKMPSPDMLLDYQKQQEHAGFGSDLQAFGAGAARAATFGLSDQTLVHSGAVNPETLADLKKYNPKSTFGGEVAGIAGSLAFAPEVGAAEVAGEGAAGALAGAKLSPVGLVGRAGQAVTEAAQPAIQGAVETALNPSVGSRVLSNVASHALGSAVEGAAYGLGQSVSENALGDPDAMGEKLLSNVGYSALFAGALGGVLGIPKGFASGAKPVEDVIQNIKNDMGETPVAPDGTTTTGAQVNPENLESNIDAMQVEPEKKATLLEGLKELKPNSKEIIDAANTIGAPVLESQVSASKHVQDLDSMLFQSPTPIGVGRQQVLQKGLDAAGKAVDEALGPGTEMSAAEVGNSIKKSLTEKFEGEADPIGKLYNQIKESTVDIPVKPQSTTRIANSIRELGGKRPSAPEFQLANSIAEELSNIENVNDIKEFKSSIARQIKGNPALSHVGGQVMGKLAELEENTIINYAEKEYNVPADQREAVLELISQRKEANLKYKKLIEKMGEIGSVAGKKRIYGPQDFLNFLDDLTPERLQKRLFAKDNSEFLKFFSENFPDETKMLSDFEKSKVREAATVDGRVMPNKALRAIDKYSPELKKVMFPEGDLKKLNAAGTYMESLPANINPSGTSKSEAYRRFYEKPLSSAIQTLFDLGKLKTIQGVVDTSGKLTGSEVSGLVNIERQGQKVQRSITQKAKNIFRAAEDIGDTYKGFAGQKLIPERQKEQKKVTEEVASYASNPQKMLDHLDDATKDLYTFAPQVSRGIQSSAIRAVQFLNQKVPRGPAPKPLSPPYIPSHAEMTKFQRYLNTVKNPVSVLDEVRSATIVPESIETLTTVYPKLYQQMQGEVLDQLTSHMSKKDKAELPFSKKMAIGMFLGTDLDDSMSASTILANQASISQSTQGGQANQGAGPAKVSQSGMNKMKMSQNMLTSQQRSSQRTS